MGYGAQINTKQKVIFGQEKNVLESRDKVVAKQLLIHMLGFCVKISLGGKKMRPLIRNRKKGGPKPTMMSMNYNQTFSWKIA